MSTRSRVARAMILVLLAVLAGGCGLPGAANEHERQVLVDYHFDQYAAVFAGYFPKQVMVHPGDTVVFKLSWTGEPHTVTMGTAVDEFFAVAWKFLKDGPPYPDKPPDDPAVGPAIAKFRALPQAESDTGNNQLVQQGAQACYVESGPPPKAAEQPCANRTLKPFNGRQVYYNSGIIRYQGGQGDTFRLAIAADATPGTHYYHCLIHGPLMSGAITIAPAAQSIPTQADVNDAAQKDLARMSTLFSAGLKSAQAQRGTGTILAGVRTEHTGPASVTEFVPRSTRARTRQKVTWKVLGFHTVSFDVPRYHPEINFARDGAVTYSSNTIDAVGGPSISPPPPDPAGQGGPPPGPQTGPPPAPPPLHVDAGEYDGGHFLSSGLGGPTDDSQEVTYSVTFTKPGTYKYACLVHPQMVGEIVVQ